MRDLVDANVLSEATKPDPDPRVVDWLARAERELVVDPLSAPVGLMLPLDSDPKQRHNADCRAGEEREVFGAAQPRFRDGITC